MIFEGLLKNREKKDPKQEKRKKAAAIDTAVLDADRKLRRLNDDYSLILQKELMIARANQRKGIKNQDNYSRIGIAYYSILLVKKAQERMQELSSTRALYNCMTEMGEALAAINGLSGKVGKMNPKKVMDGMKRMDGASGGVSADLIKTLGRLSTLEESLSGEDAKNTGVEGLVSVELIEKLINGEDIEDCLEGRAGITTQPEDMMKLFGDANRIINGGSEEYIGPEENGPVDMDSLKELIDSL
ncbi:MAG: hypothetical protein Q4F83_01855 [Eubacteriales bacterium]|nr:hypothetical protein [Eubacteriales bacterium]